VSDTYLPEGLPTPKPDADGLGTEYWEGLELNELRVQKCNNCFSFQWGPEWVCHKCHEFDMGWEKVSGKGYIYSWERVWHPVHPALQSATPYIIVLVELPDADNIRMVGNLIGDPLQEITIGSEVKTVFERHGHESESYTLVQWKLT